jgi:hypothetical protein
VLLKLTTFDIGRPSYCNGEFIKYAEDTAKAILKEHGPICETFKTATEYIAASVALLTEYPEYIADDGYDQNESERDDAQDELDAGFLHDILEDYRILLQKEYEYLTSEEAIVETIMANGYEFTESGKLA